MDNKTTTQLNNIVEIKRNSRIQVRKMDDSVCGIQASKGLIKKSSHAHAP